MNQSDALQIVLDSLEDVSRRLIALERSTPEVKDGENGRDGKDGLGVDDIQFFLGDSDYELAFVSGDTTYKFEIPLIPGSDGKDGQDGSPGERGLDGERGEKGEAGAAGETGPEGPQGERGQIGETGRDGRDGQPGERGLDGKDGVDGREGPPGKLTAVKEWAEGAINYEGVTCAHMGSTYQALRDTSSEPPSDDWQIIASAGRDGTDGRSLRVAETYKQDGEYLALDIVALNGGSFVARKDNPGPCPGPDWQVIAQRGKAGPPGERGLRGERGEAGPSVIAASVDGEGVLTLVNGDGSNVTCDFYPLLQKVVRR